MRRLLTIAGSDSGGGAGIQADLKTFAAHQTHGMSVVTAITAQNTQTVTAVQTVLPELISAQIDAVFDDIGVDAVKIGMVSLVESIEVIAERLCFWKPPIVVLDPVIYTKTGFPLLEQEAVEAMIAHLFPIAHLITPNLPEASHLVGRSLLNPQQMVEAATELAVRGAAAVLIKGGALRDQPTDILWNRGNLKTFSAERGEMRHTHGTGCTLSSAIAANLAHGLSMEEAVEKAKKYISGAIAHAFPLGNGVGPVHHFYRFK